MKIAVSFASFGYSDTHDDLKDLQEEYFRAGGE